MSIDFDGVSGHYGNLGALEKYMGNNQIAEHAVRRYAQAGLHKEVTQCMPKDIADAAHAGDDIARQIWGEVADWLGTALASIAWLLNPDAFVIGGGVAVTSTRGVLRSPKPGPGACFRHSRMHVLSVLAVRRGILRPG